MSAEDIKVLWKGVNPTVMILIIFFGAFIWIQQAVFEQHVSDYEKVTSDNMAQIHELVDTIRKDMVDLKVQNAEMKTKIEHLEEQFDSLANR